MAGDKQTGLTAALDLDGKARELGGEGEDAPVQHEMFAGSSVFGTLRTGDGKTVPGAPGRPKGARNRSTRDLVKLIEATGRHPILAMAEIVATPIDVIARTLGCTKLEAAEYHRKVVSDLAPYVAQKLPTAVQVQGADAGMLVINLGGLAGGGDGGHRALGGQLVDLSAADPDSEENQALSGGEDDASNDEPSNSEGK